MWRPLLIAALLLSVVGAAFAQSQPVKQAGGNVTRGHAAMWLQNGVIGDAGGAGGSAQLGVGYLTELGITASGTPLCIDDALTSAVGGYHQLCLGANALGGGLLSYNAYGIATPLGLFVNQNGTTYPLIGAAGGNAVMPTAPAIPANDIALGNGGTTLKDSGIAVSAQGLLAPASTPFSLGFPNVVTSAQLAVQHADTAAIVSGDASYGILGFEVYKPASGSPWNPTLEGVIGLGYHQAAGTHSGYVIGVGGTGFLCVSTVSPSCAATDVVNSTGFVEGIYGSAENHGAGNALWMIGLHADGFANVNTGTGTVTNNAAIYVTSPQVGTNKWGMYFAGAAPTSASIAAQDDLTIVPGAANAVQIHNLAASCGLQGSSTNTYGEWQAYPVSGGCNFLLAAAATGTITLAALNTTLADFAVSGGNTIMHIDALPTVTASTGKYFLCIDKVTNQVYAGTGASCE